ncbi:MAG: chitobiase/beta-hexosaminidase C-terminal domain-containing protein [Lachnospiraceae bacterium]|nr:chitobiase/beta-hexosaminidase C-terminal domain-containing protein [Lachnospiraceae bacterium]
MNCPKCGTLIPEEKLYCPNCGYAVQIVPDYDAALEQDLDKVGSDIAGTVNRIDVAENSKNEYEADSTTKEIPMVRKDEATRIRRNRDTIRDNNDKFSTFAVAGLLTLALVVGTVIASKGMSDRSFIPERVVNEVISANQTVSEESADKKSAAVISENTVSAAEINAQDTETVSENDAPEYYLNVTPESGDYDRPYKIRASVSGNAEGVSFNGIIYYTDDGSEPDERSEIYRHEIDMPVGKSHFAFRFLDARGNLSETMYLDYDLNYKGAITAGDAVNLCVATLIKDGALLDTAGHIAGSLGTFSYVCETMVESGNRVYFMITEYYADPGAAPVATGTVYAVDAENMGLYSVKRKADGKYGFEVFY